MSKYVCYEIAHYIPKIDIECSFGDNDPTTDMDTYNIRDLVTGSPERRLWITVLLQGIKSALHGDAEDIAWLYDKDGFDFVCQLLNLNPDKIRYLIKKHADKTEQLVPQSVHIKFNPARLHNKNMLS